MNKVLTIMVAIFTILFIHKHAHMQPIQARLTTKNGIIRILDDQGKFFCSGTVISKTLVMTAGHCVVTMSPFGLSSGLVDKVQISSDDGLVIVPGKAIGADSRMDRGLIEGDFSKFSAYDVEQDPKTELADVTHHELLSCGYPLGAGLYCTPLHFTAIDYFSYKMTGAIYPGMSGGPVFDLTTHKVVGINSAMDHEFAIISTTLAILQELLPSEGPKTK